MVIQEIHRSNNGRTIAISETVEELRAREEAGDRRAREAVSLSAAQLRVLERARRS